MLGSEPNALPLGYWALVLVIGVEPILLVGNRFWVYRVYQFRHTGKYILIITYICYKWYIFLTKISLIWYNLGVLKGCFLWIILKSFFIIIKLCTWSYDIKVVTSALLECLFFNIRKEIKYENTKCKRWLWFFT